MKRFTMAALTALMVFALTVPAWALETQFGGYWRFRAVTSQNMTGEDASEMYDLNAADLRARLYFTTIFHENLKFVTKFEMDTAFGADAGGDKGGGNWGDIGADGTNLEIKNAYADFNLGVLNVKVGSQYGNLGRAFLFADDFIGIVATVKAGPLDLPLIWIKAYEGGMGKDKNDLDVDYYGVAPSFSAGAVKINPFFLYAYSEEISDLNGVLNDGIDDGWKPGLAAHEINLWYAGMNVDANFDAASLWLTGIYQGGDMDDGVVRDFKAWLAAAGFCVNLPFGDIHGQGFYATGQDPEETQDMEAFWVPAGDSYYWSEIMGVGDLRDTYYVQPGATSNNSPGEHISNVMAGNLGVTIKPMDKLKIALDVWYASLIEDVVTLKNNKENYLGTEVDLKISIQLVQGLNLDLIGAYLFAGEATTMESEDEADPYEVGTVLSLSF